MLAVRVTAIATDTLTIARGQEGSTARTVVVGDQIMAAITAKTLTDIETFLDPVAIDTPEAHGAKRDGKLITAATYTHATRVVTCATAAFTAGDVGKVIIMRSAATRASFVSTVSLGDRRHPPRHRHGCPRRGSGLDLHVLRHRRHRGHQRDDHRRGRGRRGHRHQRGQGPAQRRHLHDRRGHDQDHDQPGQRADPAAGRAARPRRQVRARDLRGERRCRRRRIGSPTRRRCRGRCCCPHCRAWSTTRRGATRRSSAASP